jgi:hypothetical protein
MKRIIPIHLFILAYFISMYSFATKITVTSTANSGAGTLRNAISLAAPNDTIVFAPALSGSTITLLSGSLPLTKNVTIIGLGASSLAISGNNGCRIFYINAGIRVKVTNLKIINGKDGAVSTTGRGGGVFNNANATFENVTFQNCNTYGSPNSGGAIFNTGTGNLTITNCTFLNNNANGFTTELTKGGALYSDGISHISTSTFSSNTTGGTPNGGAIFNTDTMGINQSTFNGNSASGFVSGFGGAIFNETTGDLEIINSTISGNSVGGKGGAEGAGLFNNGITRLVFSTVTLNSASSMAPLGGGFYNTGIFALHSALVAQNSVSFGTGTEDGANTGFISDFGYNLIGISNPGLGLTDTTNITGTSASPVNPLLGPLQNNGGPTFTHALLAGSPAIDAGNPSSLYHLTVDQRNFPRPINTAPDIGSFEFGSGSHFITITSPTAGSTFTAPATITITASVNGTGTGAYLRVMNPSGGYRKIKLGYDPTSIYRGSQNVVASGNNKLEIVLKDFTGTADWTKIQIRPNGSTVHPLALAPYVTAAGGIGSDFNTITIPLTDFDPSIDFTHLTLFELPYSVNAAPFDIAIEKIIFTGGTTPFLWFGDSKTNNAHDGSGAGGELVASLVPTTGLGGVQKVEFFNSSTKIGEDFTPPFSIVWHNVSPGSYSLHANANTNSGTVLTSSNVNITVVAGAILFSEAKSGSINSTNDVVTVYPNPVQNKLMITQPEGNVNVSVLNEMGSIVFRSTYSSLPMGEADLSNLQPGIYILKLEGIDSSYLKMIKLIKQ